MPDNKFCDTSNISVRKSAGFKADPTESLCVGILLGKVPLRRLLLREITSRLPRKPLKGGTVPVMRL